MLARLWKKWRAADEGAIAPVLGVLGLVLVLSGGAAIDYGRAASIRDDLQNRLDAALLAAATTYSNLDDEEMADQIRTYLEATMDETFSVEEIEIDRSENTVTATLSGAVETVFMQVADVKTIDVGVESTVAGPATSYMDVYLLLDRSASMDLAATAAGQAIMRTGNSATSPNCEFACHTEAVKVGGVTYTSYKAFADAKGVKTRHDVLVDAAERLLDVIDEADPSHQRIRVGVYFFDSKIKEEQSPTFSTDTARSALDSEASGMSNDGTYFDEVLPDMADEIGTAGDGKTASSPLKLVLLITDGVQSKRSWVTSGSQWNKCQVKALTNGACTAPKMGSQADYVAPLAPSTCTPIKSKGATLAVLYTEYLAIPSDWGYQGTVGNWMPSSWAGGSLTSSAASMTRQAYLPTALAACASSGYYMSGNTDTEIETNLEALFLQYLKKIRLVS